MPGDVRQTARYLDGPSFSQAILGVGEQIDEVHRQITGQRDFTERNFTRGGSQAFQDLLSTSTGRETIRHYLLQVIGLESIAWQVLISMQAFGGKMDLRFQRPALSSERKRYIDYFEITEDDIRQRFELTLDLDRKRRKGAMDRQMAIAEFDRRIASPYTDHYKVMQNFYEDDIQMQEEMLTRDEVERIQREEQAARVEGMRMGRGQPQGAPVQPALAGAMAGGTA